MPRGRSHNPTKTFAQMKAERRYDPSWVERDDEFQKRAEFLQQVQKSFAVGGKPRNLKEYEKAKKGKAAKILAQLHKQSQRLDEFDASIPNDAARRMFQSPTGSPTGGPTPVLIRTMTPLKLGGKKGKPVQAAGGKGKGGLLPPVNVDPVDPPEGNQDDGNNGNGTRLDTEFFYEYLW